MDQSPHNGNGHGPLDPGALAEDIMIREGLTVTIDDTLMVDRRGPLTAPQIHAFTVPDVNTLPVLGRHGLVLQGGTNLLYSYPKLGKTELLTAVVAEWTDAGLTVLYLTEEPFPNWKRRLTTHLCSNETLRIFYAWGCDLYDVLEVVRSETFDVLVVDTLRNTTGYLEGKGDEDVARVIHPLVTAAEGSTVLCAYHARKMPGEGGRDISGHHSLYGAFDRAIQLAPIDGQEDHRRLTVSGRCMYEGDTGLTYKQVEPGWFEVLDGATLVEQKKVYTLTCLDCGDEFTARRRDARFCSHACRQRHSRHYPETTPSDKNGQESETDNSYPQGSVSSVSPLLDGEW